LEAVLHGTEFGAEAVDLVEGVVHGNQCALSTITSGDVQVVGGDRVILGWNGISHCNSLRIGLIKNIGTVDSDIDIFTEICRENDLGVFGVQVSAHAGLNGAGINLGNDVAQRRCVFHGEVDAVDIEVKASSIPGVEEFDKVLFFGCCRQADICGSKVVSSRSGIVGQIYGD